VPSHLGASRLPTLRTYLVAASMIPLGALATLNMHTDAIANRFVSKLGVTGVNFRLSNLLDTALKPAGGAGKIEISNLITAIIALVLLAAIVFFLFGLIRMMSGQRGGLEAVGQVAFALIVGIAGLEVVA